jgi:hypothetical protein
MNNPSNQIYVNKDRESFVQFLRAKEQRKASENRINRLESIIKELEQSLVKMFLGI